jgi:hypothetical protein
MKKILSEVRSRCRFDMILTKVATIGAQFSPIVGIVFLD